MSATMKMFCMFITLVSYFISVRQIYDTFIVHTLTEDVKVKRSSQVDIRIGNFFGHLLQNQPFLPAIQRSADSSSNSRAATLPYRPEKPAPDEAPAAGSTRLTGVPFHQKKPNQPHPAASSAQPIQLQTHSPSTQASSFPVKTLLKKWITGPSPKAVTSVPIPTTPPVR